MRKETLINQNWIFTKMNNPVFSSYDIPVKESTGINIPHTWNAFDGQDGGNDYYRNACWYQKRMDLPETSDAEELYLEFEAVNSIADVYINGVLIGSHHGGYSTFRFNISNYAGSHNILLSVCVDNSDNPDVYPRTADYTFFGGIYRDVKLLIVPKTHFGLNHYGSHGIYIDAEVNTDTATLSICSEVDNAVPKMQVCWELIDANGNLQAKQQTEWSQNSVSLQINNPSLWNGRKNPYMYTVRGSLLNDSGDILDVYETPFGIRSFYVDSEKGFFLNGTSYPLHGVSRHQDHKDKGWAIFKENHEEDMGLICEIGATSIRLAHYQHAAYFYDLCDQNGMVVWAEIPFISEMSKTEKACQNLIDQMSELILQNYNHPSICFWGLENETTIQSLEFKDDPELVKMIQKLQDLCKELNPSRMTCQAFLSNVPGDSQLTKISDLSSFNHYFGWYGGELKDLPIWLDKFHADHPEVIVGVSEYGGDGSIRYHNDKPQAGDYTEDYQAILHEEAEATFHTRPYVWSHYVWNMFDFASDRRDEGGAPGLNQKGLVTHDRKVKKDAFYLYKAYWSDEPFVHICGHSYTHRTAKARTIKVYSNQPDVTLSLNGEQICSLCGDKIFQFEITLELGETKITASAGTVSDELTLTGVEKYDKSYKMPELEGKAGIVNWFENADDFHFVDGTYSINDKIGDIIEFEETYAILHKYFSPHVDMNLIKQAKSFKLAKLLSRLGIPSELAIQMNDELSQIQKPDED